ncbi:hypothetical protein IU459_30100 [Nocardia amamiensis]|uniref:Uncharacterized protein n=1 Tax=Nocardia amamiensis TaxID=404578 RepID=A0ABS0CYT3_9NOCA|nr:hypothetical protein [Nocardia amamiensis]MBF6301764.1 hypothetical protein [Nocardia amamiensis]
MLDYHGNAVTLVEFLSALSGGAFPDPQLSGAQQEAIDVSNAHPRAALLGAFYGHLLVHAASDGAELALLDDAAALWSKGTALCGEIGTVRADLEHAMENPSAPGSADSFNTAVVRAQQIAYEINALRPDIDALRAAVLSFSHVPEHPRQSDIPIDQWDWGNLIHARRTDALTRNLLNRANSPAERAFALGVVASYGANSSGSAYLGHAVGGPRRSHRQRDRLARNTVGAWLAEQHPAARPLGELADTLPAALPSELEQLLEDGLSATFDLAATQPLPDLATGHRRLIQHLQLLTRFSRPPVPTPPGVAWTTKLYSDPSNPPPSLRPQNVDVVGQDGGGVAVQYGGGPNPGAQSPGKDDASKAGAVCGIIAAVLILLDVLQAFARCIIQALGDDTCTFWDNMLLQKIWEQDPPDPTDPGNPQNPNVTAEALTVIVGKPYAAQLVAMLFDAHNTVWEAMERAYGFLASTGLIMPDGLLGMPLYGQFTSLPAREEWPRRPEEDPVNTYHLPPASPIEFPVRGPSPFGPDASPVAYVSEATATALRVWMQNVVGQQDTDNLDLDADRGDGHLCWRAGGSVNDDPVAVEVLAYEEQE